MPTWEAEIKIRRNGRLVKWERAEGETPGAALAAVHNDLELWAQDYDIESGTLGRVVRVREACDVE